MDLVFFGRFVVISNRIQLTGNLGELIFCFVSQCGKYPLIHLRKFGSHRVEERIEGFAGLEISCSGQYRGVIYYRFGITIDIHIVVMIVIIVVIIIVGDVLIIFFGSEDEWGGIRERQMSNYWLRKDCPINVRTTTEMYEPSVNE